MTPGPLLAGWLLLGVAPAPSGPPPDPPAAEVFVPPGALEGIVLHGGRGRPARFTWLALYPEPPADASLPAADALPLEWIKTDSSGHFRVFSLAPGRYRLAAGAHCLTHFTHFDEVRATAAFRPGTPVEVPSGETARRQFTVNGGEWEEIGAYRYRLRDLDGDGSVDLIQAYRGETPVRAVADVDFDCWFDRQVAPAGEAEAAAIEAILEYIAEAPTAADAVRRRGRWQRWWRDRGQKLKEPVPVLPFPPGWRR